MRVLWLCNIMLPLIAQELNMEASNKEGWLSGLATAVLNRKGENQIELAVAFPVNEELAGAQKYDCDGCVIYEGALADGGLKWYGFSEDVRNPHVYEGHLENSMAGILRRFQPDVVNCFGSEYPHTLAMCRVFPQKERILVGMQGLCTLCAEAYFAHIPDDVIRCRTLRDVLRKDDLQSQQRKFVLRGEMEREAVRLAGNITGRTAWDKKYTTQWNPKASYYTMNETLRPGFYDGKWSVEACEPHTIFVSQGDYPLKGLHYMLMALPAIRRVYPDVKLYVAGNCIVGDGGLTKRLKLSAYGKYLRKLIRTYQLEETVCFLGRLDEVAMRQQYLKSHLFVCCSSLENSPNSLGEAMLLGMPCVSANVGGVSSIFTGGQDGIVYEPGDSLQENVERLAQAVVEMWSDVTRMSEYGTSARNHALQTHDAEVNYRRMLEIYTEIGAKTSEIEAADMPLQTSDDMPQVIFVSNYINHHQIPFCEAMFRYLKGKYAFIQTVPMEEERVSMGWQDGVQLPYVKRFYEEPKVCGEWIAKCPVVIFGGVDDESYIQGRLAEGKPVIRYSERLYKEGQWKAISPKGLLRKYKDHTKYRKAEVYLLCAGAYVPSDFHIVRAYPDKMLKWGYFPETRQYDVDKLLAGKKPATILWAARFLDWKHPEMALACANYLKSKGISFQMRIVGDGQQRPLVDALMEEYGLSDCVTLLGYRTPDEVRSLMEETDIYLATSDRKEGWGAVINEAMNSGCAVVANHMMGAVPYLIDHGRNGFVYEDGKPGMLFEWVEKLLSDRQLCHKVGREAVKTIESEWNADNATRSLLQFCVQKGFVEASAVEENGKIFQVGQEDDYSGPGSAAEVISERKMICKLL